MAEKQDARAGRETGPHRIDHLVGIGDWQWQRLDHQFGLAVLRHEGPRALERAVFVVGGQNQRGGHVRHVYEVVGRAADVASQRCARLGEKPALAAAEELHRLPLQLTLPLLVALEDRSWTGSE